MADPHVNMSPAADLVMALVMIVLLVAWLGLVFIMARKPYWDTGGHGEGHITNARRAEAIPPSAGVPAGQRVPAPAGQPVAPARGRGTSEPPPHGASQTR